MCCFLSASLAIAVTCALVRRGSFVVWSDAHDVVNRIRTMTPIRETTRRSVPMHLASKLSGRTPPSNLAMYKVAQRACRTLHLIPHGPFQPKLGVGMVPP